MGFIVGRVLGRLAALAGGGLLGWLAGTLLRAPMPGMLVGAAVGVAALAAFDTHRGARLIEWLRGAQDTPAPRDAGLWGELAYRVERALRLREQALEREKLRLQQFLSAIEVSPNGVLMLDENDQIDWCNSASAAHFGIDPQRDRRQRITNLVRSPAFVAHLQSRRHDEPVVVQQPGGRGTLSIIVRPYGEGRRLVLSQDVTERERTERMRRDFVANVSHEIRTPLTVLAGFVETLASLPLTDVERKRVLQLMAQQAARMQALVGDLLTLAQLEGSPRPPHDRWVPLARLYASAESDGRALSAGRHDMDVQPPPADVEVAGADQELQSAIGNLVSNAVRYTPERGRIELTWRRLANGDGEVAVRDTGIGIAREHLPRLAERFYRVDLSRARDTGGTGLGLSIVKHVVQRLGGELDVQSELGRGSTFRLVIPAARVREAGDRSDTRPVEPAQMIE